MDTLFIRADANEEIGTGHVMRCLSISERVRESGGEVCFLIADERSARMITERGFQVICLHSVWNDLDSELEKLTQILCEKKAERLLVDSYYVTEKYLTKLRKLTQVSYIDDLNLFDYPVDRLINYNFYGEEVAYHCLPQTEYLLGPKYAPLREEFSTDARRQFGELQKILITTGGTDSYGVAESVLNKLLAEQAFDHCEIFCVLGRFHKDRDRLIEQYRRSARVHILVNVNNMSDYMRECDVAVTAGGTTTYEICACGLPSLMYTLADNQFDIAKTVDRLGIMPWIGDVRESMENCMERMIQELKKLADLDCRRRISEKMRAVTDGRGAMRIAQKLMEKQNK